MQQRSSSSTAAVVLLGTFSRPFRRSAGPGPEGMEMERELHWHPAGGPLSWDRDSGVGLGCTEREGDQRIFRDKGS